MPPKETPSSRKFLSLNGKLEVIEYFNRTKCSIRKLAKHFCIGKTQAGEIIKKKNKYLELQHSEIQTATLRPESSGFLIDKCVYQWYSEKKEKNIPVSGPMLQNKALEIAKELGNEEFKASNGWLERFRVRHKIRSRTSKRRTVTREKEIESDIGEWKQQLDLILDTYTAENVFSAVETGLFFGAVPEETPHLITETCSSGNLADQRLTILFCMSMDGKKENPLVIAKPPKGKPDGECDFSKYQVLCEFNNFAWLTRNIVVKWLRDFDKRMADQKRNIVLFMSDAFFYCEPPLRNINIVYFSPCLSSENQTLNQGVIQNFKIIYRQLLLKRLIELKENDEKDSDASSQTISQGISWVEMAWSDLSESVIYRCFEEIGFSFAVPNTVSDNEAFLNEVSNLLYAYDSDVNAVDYVSIDADLITLDLECDEPELIEVLVDGNEMRDILMQDEELDKGSKNAAPEASPPSFEDMEELDITSPATPCSESLERKSKPTSAITSYSEALLALRNLERFYLSQKDSKADLLVSKLIAHHKNKVKKQ